jgi:hypothetical protein
MIQPEPFGEPVEPAVGGARKEPFPPAGRVPFDRHISGSTAAAVQGGWRRQYVRGVEQVGGLAATRLRTA